MTSAWVALPASSFIPSFPEWLAAVAPRATLTPKFCQNCPRFMIDLTSESCDVPVSSNQQEQRRRRGEYRSLSVLAYPSRGPDDHTAVDDAVEQRAAFSRRPFSSHAVAAMVAVAGAASTTQPASAVDPQKDWNTALPPPPALLLPVQRIRVSAAKLTELVQEPRRWEEATSLLRSPPLAEPEFTTALNRYSESNWEKHLLGDLYRNQGLESIKALEELIAYALEQKGKGAEISQDDVDDVRNAGRALLASLDDFVSLAPPVDVQLVEKLVTQSLP